MSKSKFSGNYTKAFLSKKVSSADSAEQLHYDKTIDIKENEATYIYSFKENKLVFSKGLESLHNIKSEEINIFFIRNLIAEHFLNFSNEYHDRLLLHIYNNKNIENFSTNIILNYNTFDTPVLLNIKVFETDDNGNLLSVISKAIKSEKLKTTKVVQYSLNGSFQEEFNNEINFNLDHKLCISEKNIELIELLEKGKSVEDIATLLSVPVDSIMVRISNLFKRFDVTNNKDLIQFAKTNFLIPNQFKIFS